MNEGGKGDGKDEDEKKPARAFPLVLKTKYGSEAPKKPPPRQLKRTKGEGGGPNGLRAEALRMHNNLHEKWNPKNAVDCPKNTKILRQEVEGQALILAYDALSSRSPSPFREEVLALRRMVMEMIVCNFSALPFQYEDVEEGRTICYVELSDLEKLVAKLFEDWTSPCESSNKQNFSFRYSIAASTDKGVRSTNEDYYLVIEHFNELLGLAGTSQIYFGLYDGHSGKQAAEYCRAHLHLNIAKQQDFDQDVGQAMTKAFLETDERYNEAADRLGVNDGTTAMAVLVREDSIVVANCGDARAFLYRGGNGEGTPLCPYQHPSREDEKERVKQAGGAVVWFGTWRVNGVLAISRSIGDPALRTVVIAEPEVQSSPLTPGLDDFFVLATDGLWDVMEPAAVATFIRATSSSHGPEGIAQALVNEAVNHRDSKDNVTVIVVFLRWP